MYKIRKQPSAGNTDRREKKLKRKPPECDGETEKYRHLCFLQRSI